LVALIWIRLFKPLLEAGFPQGPSNVGHQGLGFVTEAFKKLTVVSHLDLRIGMAFTGEIGVALHESLKDAATTITRMPATYMAYPNGGQILPVNRIGRVIRPSRVLLDLPYLSSFGDMLVPRHLWRAMQRFDAWIEPALVSEWMRLIKFYASRQGRSLEDSAMAVAMAWQEPTRDVRVARERATKLSESGQLFCVWSDQKLVGAALDLDHCFPWAIWPCGDLWNLVPAHRTVNQREKRSRLPSDRLLRASKNRIMNWWEAAYLQEGSLLPERFWLEATSSLPRIRAESDNLHDVFEAVCLRRLKLKHDQQVPEWAGEQYVAAAG
jgi:HNH endonuclease